jgi:two-component system chemotaxis response regulator CheY
MNRRVLLVDDNRVVRQAIFNLLVNVGYEVVEATDGLDGLTKAKASYFDALVIDYKMPIMDGITLIKGLREMSQYQQHPIILLTTEDSAEFSMKVAGLDNVNVMCKPVDQDLLVSLVAKQNLVGTAISA